MDEVAANLQAVWVNPQADSSQNQQQVQIFRLCGARNLVAIKQVSELSPIIQKLKKHEKVVVICSTVIFKKVLEGNVLRNKKVFPKVIIYCSNEEVAKKHKVKYPDTVFDASANDLVVVTAIGNVQCEIDKNENEEVDEKKLNPSQYYSKLKNKDFERSQKKSDRHEIKERDMHKQRDKPEEKREEKRQQKREKKLKQDIEQKSQEKHEVQVQEGFKEEQAQKKQKQQINIPKRQEVEVDDQLSSDEDGDKEKDEKEEKFEKQEQEKKQAEKKEQKELEEGSNKDKEQNQKKEKLKGIWVDANISHNYHIIDRLSQYINIQSFDTFDEVLDLIEREIEANNGNYVLIFANNMANSVLAIEKQHYEEEENQGSCSNSLYPYENVQDYIIYCGNESIAYNILSQAGLEDQVFVTCEESKLVKRIKQIYQSTFQNN